MYFRERRAKFSNRSHIEVDLSFIEIFAVV